MSASFTKLPTARAWKLLPKAVKGRSYSDFEAFTALALFIDWKGHSPGQREAARLWGWGRARVRKFLQNEQCHFLKPEELRTTGAKAIGRTNSKTTFGATKSIIKQGNSEMSPATPGTTKPASHPTTNTRLVNSDLVSQEGEGTPAIAICPKPFVPTHTLSDELLGAAEERHTIAGYTPSVAERKASQTAIAKALERHGEARTREALDGMKPRPWRFFPANLEERLVSHPGRGKNCEAESLAHARTGRGKGADQTPATVGTRSNSMEEYRQIVHWFDGLGGTESERRDAVRAQIAMQYKRAGCEPSRIAAEVEESLQKKLIRVERARQEAQGLTKGSQAMEEAREVFLG